MDEYIEKHLIDILNAATEVESYYADAPKRFQDFQNECSGRGQWKGMLK